MDSPVFKVIDLGLQAHLYVDSCQIPTSSVKSFQTPTLWLRRGFNGYHHFVIHVL